jgi:histidine triad (HIT) family protein
MNNHAPESYRCPICPAVQGLENEDTLIKQSDIVYQDDLVTAFIGSFFIGKNDGHPIVVPNQHYENIYDLPDEVGGHIFEVAKKLALAVRQTYGCEGITILQNNEPAGGQHAFHYHTHIFPRYTDDGLHANMLTKRQTTPEE